MNTFLHGIIRHFWGSLHKLLLPILCSGLFLACSKDQPKTNDSVYPAIKKTFGGSIDPENLPNYANQEAPAYVAKDNTGANPITDEGATLGRVLFYDVQLSVTNTISCSSCHQQQFAFSDTAKLSRGINGLTNRHAMRLVNARFGAETRFFWDERAATLEEQTTMPIQDHLEMGYSGQEGDPGIEDLIDKLQNMDYYQELFTLAFGDTKITELRMQAALAQFIRSIQSFDSKYDAGRATGALDGNFFPNYTAEENEGKRLFMFPLGVGGAGCAGCHLPPEFDIALNIGNNGVLGVAKDPTQQDLANTRSPSLRDVFNRQGVLNGPLMHDGSFTNMLEVIDHYDQLPEHARNANLDQRLIRLNGSLQNLELTREEKNALVTFLKTLSGSKVYTDEKYADPFP